MIESCRAKKIVLPLAMSALFLSCGINSTDKKNSEFFPPVQSKDEHILALEAKNRALEESQKKYFNYFIWLFGSIVAGTGILVALNLRQSKLKDKMLLNSEQFLRYSIEGQEAERKRISQELHDSVAQTMRYVLLLAENLDDKEAAAKIIEAQNSGINAIRNLCYNLTPPTFGGSELLPSICLLGKKIFDTENSGFQFRAVCEPAVDFAGWNGDALMNLYRVVQEALQNIQRHAEAGEATVFFKKSGVGARGLKVIITDDGRGMNPSLVEQINRGVFEAAQENHFGLRNIFERVKFLGGRVEYVSDDGVGTRIVVEI